MCMIWVSGPSSSYSLIRANASSDLFVGKVESNEVFCGAVEEEEGGEKLVEIIEVWITIEEELKAGEVIVGKPPSFIDKFLNNKGDLEEDFNVGRYDRYWYSASIAVTITYSAPIDVQRADRSPL
ncbi:hypothetical protein L249_8357 [Ophiocordyceps polyrhachis-furcata BCC 54312]|uniref:Uncharacterized protein n=1 Tax=Ophiocordyceps polyrhachis-furcata BCC 54312 TaxID=1330021 RepID=A0A367L1E4_9HYPO|nr:hypothetical protein L249_8357 [Ophiocordyceps polyrhachis-furcata BCC 54312]